jgi:hypothetical protein
MQPPKHFAFVLMPFDRAFDDVYRLGIKGAVEQFDDVLAERVDEQIQQSICLFPESPFKPRVSWLQLPAPRQYPKRNAAPMSLPSGNLICF